WPRSGVSKPATSLRQDVFPEPEGPSMAKNSPGSMANETSSTARTSPKMRETPRNSMAAVIAATTLGTGTFFGSREGSQSPSLAADDRDVVGDPAAIGHAAFGMRRALRFRRAPELELVEILDAVVLAALGAEQLVAFA